jgi:hypothetical protein
MSTLADEVTTQVRAVGVRIADNRLYVSLSDGREVSVPLDRVGWLEWLAEATPEERAQWSIEPGGFAIYWENLEEGIEIEHLLALKPLS